MLKACSKCGKVHKRGYICSTAIKPQQTRNTQADKFRNTAIWRKKAENIKKRDFYMCRVCREKQYNTMLQYNTYRLSVHHIVPISEDYDRRLDDDNLITLCAYHHELAENGRIPRAYLRDLAAASAAL